MSFKDKILKNQSPWGSPPPGGGGRMPGGNGSGSRQAVSYTHLTLPTNREV